MWHQHREIQYHDRMIQCYALTPISRHTVSHTEHGFFFLLRRRRRALVNAAFRRFGRCPPLENYLPLVISGPCAMWISSLLVPMPSLAFADEPDVNSWMAECVPICRSANKSVSVITLGVRCWIQRPRLAGAILTHGLAWRSCFMLVGLYSPAGDRQGSLTFCLTGAWVSASTLSWRSSARLDVR